MNYLHNLLLAGDIFINAIAGGSYKSTISARVGYFAKEHKSLFWRSLEKVINETFRPLEGADHCLHAYLSDTTREHQQGSDLARAFLAVAVAVGSLFIAPVVWLLARWKED